MAIRKIITYPDARLSRVSEPVTRFDTRLATLVSDMVETMRHAPGIGLAAPQVGELLRLIIVEVSETEEEPPQLYAVCNPVILKRKGKAQIEEGCLSVPGFYYEIERSKEIRLDGQHPDGTPFTLRAEGMLAICFQHEMDHLDGKILLDYVEPEIRKHYREELNKRHGKEGSPDDRRPAL